MKILVLGVGNILRGDDGFGVQVLRAMAHRPLPEEARLVEAGLRVESYVPEMPQYDHVILIDSIDAGLEPGDLVSFTPERLLEAKTDDEESPHGLGVIGSLKLLDTLGECPPVTIIACQRGESLEGEKLSHAVETAVKSAANLVEDTIESIIEDFRI